MKVFRVFAIICVVMSLLIPNVYASQTKADGDELSKVKQAYDMAKQQKQEAQIELNTIETKYAQYLQNKAINFYDSIKGKGFHELTTEESEEMNAINYEILAHLGFVSEGYTINNWYEDGINVTLAEAIEGLLLTTSGTVTLSEINVIKDNASDALQIGNNYAMLNGWNVAQDNPADAYRHFAWNFFNAQDFGNSTAKKIGDYHEVVNVATPIAEGSPYTGIEQISFGVASASIIYNETRDDFDEFEDRFNDANIMDLHNNYKGLYYSLNYNSVADAFYEAYFEDSTLIGWISDVSSALYHVVWQDWRL